MIKLKTIATPIVTFMTLAVASPAVLSKSTIGGIVFTNYYIEQLKANGEQQVTNTVLDVANNSRFRIRWDNEDNVGMYIEMSLRDEDKDTLRHAYGKWDISQTQQLLVGQTSTPFAPLNPNVAMVHNSGQGYGSVSPSRPSQVRYTYKFLNKQGAVAVALVDPNKGEVAHDINGQEVAGQRENNWPRLDVGMAYKAFNWQIFPSFFVHQQQHTQGADLSAYGYSLGAKTAWQNITFTGEIGVGRNWGNTRMSITGSWAGDDSGAIYNDSGDRVADNDNQGYWLDIGYRFTGVETKGTLHFVYGSLSSEAGDLRDKHSTMVGISTPIDLPWIARGFRIRPELFRFKDEDKIQGTSQTQTILGVQFQYTF